MQVGGGYDSYSSVFGNFRWAIPTCSAAANRWCSTPQIGFLFQNYSISYTEPWFLDMPLAVSLQVFDNKSTCSASTRATPGSCSTPAIRWPSWDFKKLGPFSLKDVTAGLGYQFQSVGITGLAPITTYRHPALQGLYADFRIAAEHPPLHGR